METSIAIVQIGHGFSRKPETINDYGALSEVDLDLCEKTISVVEFFKTADYYFLPNCDYLQKGSTDDYSREIQFWNTGQVSWESTTKNPSITLATLTAEKLMETYPRKRGGHLYRKVPGENPFSECWNAVIMMKLSKINVSLIVASDFYLNAYAPMWKATAERAGLDMDRMVILAPMVHAPDAVPREVIKHHQSFQTQILCRLAESCALGHKLAMLFAKQKTQKNRIKGWDAFIHTKAV